MPRGSARHDPDQPLPEWSLSVIEIQFDMNEIERALDKLYGSKKLLSEAVSSALSVTVPEVRKRVIGVLKDEVTVGERFIKRAVKTAQIRSGLGEFRVVSKRLFLDDYELSPRVPTARPGNAISELAGLFIQVAKKRKDLSQLRYSNRRRWNRKQAFFGDNRQRHPTSDVSAQSRTRRRGTA